MNDGKEPFYFKKKEGLLLCLILCCVTLAYLPSLRGEFLSWDDDIFVPKNPRIQDLSFEGVIDIFTTSMPVEDLPGEVTYEYFPIRDLTYLMDYSLWGLDSYGYHLTNIVIHLANTVLIWMISAELGIGSSIRLFSTLLFSLHPVNVESVAWVSARKDLVYLLFFLLSLFLYLLSLRKKNNGFLFLSLLSAFLSVLSKFPALLLPLVISVYFLVFPKKISTFRSLIHITLFLITTWGVTLPINPDNKIVIFRWKEGVVPIITNPTILISPLSKLLFPIHLSAIYDKLFLSPYAAVMIVVFLGGISSYMLASRIPHASFFVLWTLCQLPILVRFGLYGITIADRYLYTASIGSTFVLVTAFSRLSNGWIRNSLLSVITLCFLCLTVMRVPIWENNLSLWEDAVRKSPSSAPAHMNLGIEYEKLNSMEKAELEYHKVLEIPRGSLKDPVYILALRNLGAYDIRQGKYDRAVKELEEAALLDPGYADVHRFLGALYLNVYHDKDKGLFHLRRSLELAPDQPDAEIIRKAVELGGDG